MKIKKPKNVFKEGAISSEFIGTSIANHQSKTGIGAHNIFLGQVRADEINGSRVPMFPRANRENVRPYSCILLPRISQED